MAQQKKERAALLFPQALATVREGDVMDLGVLFKFAPKERLSWRCTRAEAEFGHHRCWFDIAFRGVVVRRAVATLVGEAVTWRDA